MTQFPAGARFFAVVVECQAIDAQQPFAAGHVSEEIDHRGMPQRAGAAER
jgi:hypothetical protein